MFMTAVVVRPLASTAQTDGGVLDGTTRERANDLEDSFKDMESLDTESVEANPVAPDDTDDSAATSAASPVPVPKVYPIPVPLHGGLDHVANGVATRNAGF